MEKIETARLCLTLANIYGTKKFFTLAQRVKYNSEEDVPHLYRWGWRIS